MSHSHELTVEAISSGLTTHRVGRKVVVLPETGSTNAHALDVWARSEGPSSDGWTLFAEYQSAGRGRLGREWQAPRGASILCTVLLWEDFVNLSPARLTLSTAVAAAKAIDASCHIEPNIRWPNDLYIGSRKVGGILVEARSAAAKHVPVAIGIGINCLQHAGHFPPELSDRATSLQIESSEPIDRTRIARELLRQLDSYFSQDSAVSDAQLIEEWRSRSTDIGTHVTLTSDGHEFRGRIVDIHPTDGLLLQIDGGGRRHFDPSTTSRL